MIDVRSPFCPCRKSQAASWNLQELTSPFATKPLSVETGAILVALGMRMLFARIS